jgi:hypothetical protein
LKAPPAPPPPEVDSRYQLLKTCHSAHGFVAK